MKQHEITEINNILNVDWLCLSCRGDVCQPSFNYSLTENTERKSRLFARFFDLDFHGEHIATIEAEPKTPMIAKDLFLLRFDNHILYRPNLYDFVHGILLDNHWSVNNINRLDICADFTTFKNQVNTISPQLLIDNLFSGEWHRKGERKVVFHAQDGYTADKILTTKKGAKVVYFNKESNFESSKVTGYRAGSRASAVCVYLYNKSLELRSVKDKPYIRKLWNKVGFMGDVWRLEFSLHGKFFDNLTLDSIKTPNLCSLFAKLVADYFDIMFYLPDKSIVHVPLFDTPQYVQDLNFKTRPANADRSAMRLLSSFIANLAKLQNTNDSFPTTLEIAVIEGTRFFDLYEYSIQKCLSFKLFNLAKILRDEKQKNQ